ncbi:unnamed protein product [Litomosoides sigmodontis]|uniref:Uncharacterized protein n=1 Tax=Litomosoides sigmodontis TaxID=42156 RepID=A0A3P6SBG9_LITSI|nr:unnamed protein product [Litomosoides sigmodontis]
MQFFFQFPDLISGTPSRCDASLLLEYLNHDEYEYYMGIGYANSCISTMLKIESSFQAEDMIAAVESLHDLQHHRRSNVVMHEETVVEALRTQDIQCSFNNMHPILIGFNLNVTIIVNFDDATKQLTIVLAESVRNQPTSFRYFYRDHLTSESTYAFLTAVDMGRGLLHFIKQNDNESSFTMDPSGAYAFYAIPEKHKQQAIYQLQVHYPNFTLHDQGRVKILTVNEDDQIVPIDRSALFVWKYASEKR